MPSYVQVNEDEEEQVGKSVLSLSGCSLLRQHVLKPRLPSALCYV